MRLRLPSSPLHDETIVVRLPKPRDADALVRFGDDEDVRETIWAPIPTPCSRAEGEVREQRPHVCGERVGPVVVKIT